MVYKFFFFIFITFRKHSTRSTLERKALGKYLDHNPR